MNKAMSTKARIAQSKKCKQKVESNSKKYIMKCSLCSFETSTSELINYHFGKEGHFATGVNVTCPHCPYMASSPKDLYRHGKSHSQGFVLFSYICKLCNFKAITLASIENHIKQHSCSTKLSSKKIYALFVASFS